MDKDFNKKGKKRKSFAKSKIKSNEKVTSLDSVRQKSNLKNIDKILMSITLF